MNWFQNISHLFGSRKNNYSVVPTEDPELKFNERFCIGQLDFKNPQGHWVLKNPVVLPKEWKPTTITTHNPSSE